MRRATRQATVRVGGVPPDMSDIDLRELFSHSGTILSLQALRRSRVITLTLTLTLTLTS